MLRDHPLLAGFALPDWVEDPQPPDLDALTALLPLPPDLQLVNPPADDEHYEARIARCGQISTRPGSWHDAFNALIWSRWPNLKRALNRRQATDLATFGKHQRSRAQMAITHFDESGLVVVISDPVLLDAWSRHDWITLFQTHRDAWGKRIVAWPFGHALLEHLKLSEQLLLTAKAVAVTMDGRVADQLPRDLDHPLATRMERGTLLEDPQQPRPLPVSGIPGAWPLQDTAFYRTADCFRPLREGRVYPDPLRLGRRCV